MAEEKKVDELLDELLEGLSPEEIMGKDGLVNELTKRLMERALEGELTDHLGYEKNAVEGHNGGNSRNGHTTKRVKTGTQELELQVPRDRDSSFEPKLVKKGQRRLPGFDEKVIALYARGMTTREIQGHLKELYQVEVSPTLISTVTDAVLDDVKAWQSRPLDAVYAIVFLDAIHVKLRASGQVQTQAVYLALALTLEGEKELLGLWVGEAEGAKFWLSVLTELKNRGVQDILIASIDGLKGFPEAVETVFPQTQIQLCIVHMIRGSLRYVSYKERRAVGRDLRGIWSCSKRWTPNLYGERRSPTSPAGPGSGGGRGGDPSGDRPSAWPEIIPSPHGGRPGVPGDPGPCIPFKDSRHEQRALRRRSPRPGSGNRCPRGRSYPSLS